MTRWGIAVALILLWPSFTSAEEALVEPLNLIRVSSIPPGAEVTIDGHPCGSTPGLISVTAGRHEVVITHGDRMTRSFVVAVPDETVEVSLELAETRSTDPDLTTWLDEPPEPRPRTQRPRPREPRIERAPRVRREPHRRPSPPEPWIRRIRERPWIEASIDMGMLWRNFSMPINHIRDTRSRTEARMTSDTVGAMGFRVTLYPFVRANVSGIRGLGIEAAATTAVGMEVRNTSLGEVIDSSFYDVDLGLLYRLYVGQGDRGMAVDVRLGWHRTAFYLGEYGNDLIPPFTYDTIRVGLGARVLLGTRHLLAEVHGSYLWVAGVGNEARAAYSASWDVFESHGGEVRLGLVGRVGILELSLMWIGRWMTTEFDGEGAGWGIDPSTRWSYGGSGIESTGAATDSHQQVRFGVGVRL